MWRTERAFNLSTKSPPTYIERAPKLQKLAPEGQVEVRNSFCTPGFLTGNVLEPNNKMAFVLNDKLGLLKAKNSNDLA